VDYSDNPPDLAVDVLSLNYSRMLVRDKVKQYVKTGVKLVWVIDPDDQTVTVYRGSMKGVVQVEEQVLKGSDVLPGFTCRVCDLFR
jgi:Uma2 family endonuclease